MNVNIAGAPNLIMLIRRKWIRIGIYLIRIKIGAINLPIHSMGIHGTRQAIPWSNPNRSGGGIKRPSVIDNPQHRIAKKFIHTIRPRRTNHYGLFRRIIFCPWFGHIQRIIRHCFPQSRSAGHQHNRICCSNIIYSFTMKRCMPCITPIHGITGSVWFTGLSRHRGRPHNLMTLIFLKRKPYHKSTG